MSGKLEKSIGSPMFLKPFQLVSREWRWGKLYQPAQCSRGQPAGRLHSHALTRVFVSAESSPQPQAALRLLAFCHHGAPASSLLQGTSSSPATIPCCAEAWKPNGLKREQRLTNYFKSLIWPSHGLGQWFVPFATVCQWENKLPFILHATVLQAWSFFNTNGNCI